MEPVNVVLSLNSKSSKVAQTKGAALGNSAASAINGLGSLGALNPSAGTCCALSHKVREKYYRLQQLVSNMGIDFQQYESHHIHHDISHGIAVRIKLLFSLPSRTSGTPLLLTNHPSRFQPAMRALEVSSGRQEMLSRMSPSFCSRLGVASLVASVSM